MNGNCAIHRRRPLIRETWRDGEARKVVGFVLSPIAGGRLLRVNGKGAF